MTGIKIHQIYYREDQKQYLDEGFSPWNNLKNPHPEWAELWAIIKTLKRHPWARSPELTGFVSWKFRRKTGLSSKDVLDFIDTHPGYDCYIFNPLTLQTALFASVWEQGEEWHPGIKGHGHHLLQAAGIKTDLDSYVDGFATTAYCNYLVAGPRFWKAYLSLIRKVMATLKKHRRAEVGPWQETIHNFREYHFVPFLIERFFGVVVRLHPDLKILPYRYPAEKQAERTPGFAQLIERADDLKTECRDDRNSQSFQEYLGLQRQMHNRLRLSPDREALLLR